MKKIIIIVVGIFLAFIAFHFFNNYLATNKGKSQSSNIPKPEQSVFNFLILGYGGGNHDGAYLTDTMMVAHIDTKTKKIVLVSIPRDIWVKIPTKSGADFHTKINSVYQLKLYPNDFPDLQPVSAETIVSQITGLAIDGYVSIDFSGFTKSVDILGGVDVNVQKPFTDNEYPIDGNEKELCGQDAIFKEAAPFLVPGFNIDDEIKQFKADPKLQDFVTNATETPELAFPCRYEKLSFTAGMTHMDGATALKYARSRHSETDGGDFNRAERQQQIIEAVKNKVLSVGFIPKIIPLINELKNDIVTDINQDLISKFMSMAAQAKQYSISTFALTDQNYLNDSVSSDGQFMLIPKQGIDNWTVVKSIVEDMVNGITPSPVATSSAQTNQ